MNVYRKRLENLNAGLVNVVSFLLGAVMVVCGVLTGTNSPCGVILISIGTSLIAGALVVFLSARYLERSREIQELIERWGIIGIFPTRSTMNTRADMTLQQLNRELDLMGYGFSAFRHAQGEMISEKVRRGLRLRVLTVDPHSECVAQRERAEGSVPGAIARTILDLEEWVEQLKKVCRHPGDVQLRFCDAPVTQSYYRQDGYIYTGPYLQGKPSQQTISFEFEEGGLGYDYWQRHFDTLWNDAKFATDGRSRPPQLPSPASNGE